MSKGGAGKVYFVLYLAVILELLIIIVERDEAEEHLVQKQRESMRIVESILSQLQSGSGSTGINTRPQDEITLKDAAMPADFAKLIKEYRTYYVDVGITDISSELAKTDRLQEQKEKDERYNDFIKLANVADLSYQVFYTKDDKSSVRPPIPTDEEIEGYIKKFEKEKKALPYQSVGDTWTDSEIGKKWSLVAARTIVLDEDATIKNSRDLRTAYSRPAYPEDKFTNATGSHLADYAPKTREDEKTSLSDANIFSYDHQATLEVNGVTDTTKPIMKKRSFAVYFQPKKDQEGWYQLRFSSRTNKILGVRNPGGTTAVLDDKEKVNVGTVQLEVKQLKAVLKELSMKQELAGLMQLAVSMGLGKGYAVSKELIQQFQEAVANSIFESNSKGESQTAGQKSLFGTLTLLLTPEASKEIGQNRGDMVYSVHVKKPPVEKINPTLDMPDRVATFDKLAGIFEFGISPYKENLNDVRAVVLQDGKEIAAKIILKPADELKLADVSSSKPVVGGKRFYLATIDRELSAGKYEVRVTHTIQGATDPAVETRPLEVYEAGLAPSSLEDVNQKLQYFASYGSNLKFNLRTTAPEGRFKKDEFKIFLLTDKDLSNPQVSSGQFGLAAEKLLNADANSVTLGLVWTQQYSGKTLDIFPRRTVNIKQAPPTINEAQKGTNYSNVGNKIKIRISGIRVIAPPIGTDKAPTAQDFTLDFNGKVEFTNQKPKSYKVVSTSKPKFIKDGYEIVVQIDGDFTDEDTRVKGTLKIPLTSTIRNPVNSSNVSAPANKIISIDVNYTPDQE